MAFLHAFGGFGAILFAVPVVVLCIGVHECGHALVALACGFRLIAFEVGPLKWRRLSCEAGDGAFRFRWQWKRATGGLTVVRLPSAALSGPALRYLLMVCGGPVANLLLCVVTFSFLTKTSGRIEFLASYLGVMSGAIAGATLYPTRGKVHSSDGRRIVDLTFNPSLREWHVARLLYLERLRLFKVAFRLGHMSEAAAQLEEMKKAYRTPREQVLLDIVNHLEGHIVSGESVDDCKWSPSKANSEQTA